MQRQVLRSDVGAKPEVKKPKLSPNHEADAKAEAWTSQKHEAEAEAFFTFQSHEPEAETKAASYPCLLMKAQLGW